MFKLLRYLRRRDWTFVVLILGLTVLQVYCMMTLMDYIQYITQSITYMWYQTQGLSAIFESDVLASLNALGITSFQGLIDFANSGSPLVPSELVTNVGLFQNIVDATTTDILFNAGMMVLIALSYVAVQALISVLSASIASSLCTRVRSELNKKISSFSLAEINKFSTASLVTRATNDIQQYQFILLQVFRMFFAAPTTAIWAICKINTVSWQLMLPTIIGVLLLCLGLVILIILVMPKFKKTQSLLDKLNGITREHLEGIRVVHAYDAESYQEDKFNKTNSDMTKVQLFTGRAMSILSPYISLIMNGISVAIYWIGAVLINDPSTTLEYAQLLSFMMLSTQIIMAFMMLLMMFYMLPRASVSAKRIDEVLKTEPSIKDPEVAKEPLSQGTIAFKDVSFRYPDAENNVIEHISFEAKKGETVAIIGATGSGKTTIVNLADRLYDCTEGEVVVDGVNVKDMRQATLRKLIGFVPQKGLLFRGTISSNIKLGVPEAGEDEVRHAATVAEADEFISAMEQGYNSPVAQGGTNVSGGQRQRLCIARAVITKPEFFIFDDSFSALDFKTDQKVRANLKEEAKDATKIIVAQRIGTIMDADHIVVLHEGKMVGYGTHSELLKNCDTYREIALSQLSKEELGL